MLRRALREGLFIRGPFIHLRNLHTAPTVQEDKRGPCPTMLGGRQRQETNNEQGFSQNLRHRGTVMGTGRPGRAAARGRGRPVFAAAPASPGSGSAKRSRR